MKTIEIINPTPGGSGYTAAKKAEEYVRRGRAVMEGGTLRFLTSDEIEAQGRLVFKREMVFWNGARSQYIPDTDIDLAMFPPCCNVVFPKTGSHEARRRYCERS